MRRLETILLMISLIVSLLALGRASYIDAKATLAQVLIAHAWQQTLDSGAPQRPWPWADTWPVARLLTPDGDALYVLESASGQALAFGPGRIPSPRASDGLMIAGHRDTHFRFLQTLEPGQPLALENPDGEMRSYRIAGLRVVDSRVERLLPPPHRDELMLISCYPFTAAPAGGPLRYVVYARAQSADARAQEWH